MTILDQNTTYIAHHEPPYQPLQKLTEIPKTVLRDIDRGMAEIEPDWNTDKLIRHALEDYTDKEFIVVTNHSGDVTRVYEVEK